MAEEDIQFPVPARLLDPAQCPEPYVKSYAQYKEMHRQSIENPNEFFGKVNIITFLYTTSSILFLIAIVRTRSSWQILGQGNEQMLRAGSGCGWEHEGRIALFASLTFLVFHFFFTLPGGGEAKSSKEGNWEMYARVHKQNSKNPCPFCFLFVLLSLAHPYFYLFLPHSHRRDVNMGRGFAKLPPMWKKS